MFSELNDVGFLSKFIITEGVRSGYEIYEKCYQSVVLGKPLEHKHTA